MVAALSAVKSKTDVKERVRKIPSMEDVVNGTHLVHRDLRNGCGLGLRVGLIIRHNQPDRVMSSNIDRG
jgi:hypothetical protein